MKPEDVKYSLVALGMHHLKKQADLDKPSLNADGDTPITGGDVAKYLGLYGVGGAALGAGVGALTGDMKKDNIITGMIVGGVSGTALGALALAARENRMKNNSKARTHGFDAPNWAARHDWPGTAVAGAGGMTASWLYKHLKNSLWAGRKIPWAPGAATGKNPSVFKKVKGGFGRHAGWGVAAALAHLASSWYGNKADAAAAADIPED